MTVTSPVDRPPGDLPDGAPPADSTPAGFLVPVAVLCELLALGLSVAANLAAVWADGTIAIVAAGAIPFVLIGATYLFLGDRLPVAWRLPRAGQAARPARLGRSARPGRAPEPGAPGWAAWWANLASAALILVPVASASYWHQRELLIATTAPTWIATLLPLAVDGLALRAALTLFRLAHARATSGAASSTDDAASPATSEPNAGDSADEGAQGDGYGGPDDVDLAPDEPDGADEPDVAATPLPKVRGVDPETVAKAAVLLHREPGAGRPAIRKHCNLTDHKAGLVLAALRNRPLRAVGSEAS